MKLELVLLTIVVSLITERQVEANRDRVECYEFRNSTGANFTLYSDEGDLIVNHFYIEACRVYGTWIFFEGDYYYGNVNTFSGTGDIYYPRERFAIRSIWKFPNKSDQSGIFLFQETRFMYGYFKYFSKETRNIQGQVFFKSAAVFGPSSWTVESECKGANCKNVLTCFSAPGAGKASFVEEVSNLGKILSVLPGNCLGNTITGKTKIPECPCNQGGVVDDANKCEGINGICKCKSNHTDYDCAWCHKPLVIQQDGTCKAATACGCDPRGVDADYSCVNGKCNCREFTSGDKCDQCYNWAAFTRKACQHCYCPIHKVQGGLAKCDDHTGKCNCKPNYEGDKCERCAAGFFQFKSSCITEKQLNATTTLNGYCQNGETSKVKVLNAIAALKTIGLLPQIPYPYTQVKNGDITPDVGACDVYNYYLGI